MNGRLDTMQAAVLLEKLAIFEDEIAARQTVAARYAERFGNSIAVPPVIAGAVSVWAQYTIASPRRDAIVARARRQACRRRSIIRCRCRGRPDTGITRACRAECRCRSGCRAGGQPADASLSRGVDPGPDRRRGAARARLKRNASSHGYSRQTGGGDRRRWPHRLAHGRSADASRTCGEIVVYDNFVRGRPENLADALKDPRVKIFEVGGDICQTDILERGAEGRRRRLSFRRAVAAAVPRFSARRLRREHSRHVQRARGLRARNGVKRLVYSSSASVYGDAVEEPMTEDHPFNNKNFYGATKIAGEAMARAFHHRYGLNLVGLRYMNVYGPRQDYHGAYIAVIMKMLDAIDQGERPTILGDGSEAFDFVAVEDCARANLCAMGAESGRPLLQCRHRQAAPRSRSWRRCCLRSPAATSRSVTRRAARRRSCATASARPSAPRQRSASRAEIDLREGLETPDRVAEIAQGRSRGAPRAGVVRWT